MELTDTAVAWLAIGSAAATFVALALALLAITGQRRVQRAYRVFSGGSREDVLALIERHVVEVRALREDVAALTERTDDLRRLLASAVTRVGTVRYDAFADMGGHMSYSTALLNEHGDGVVLTSIHGRNDTRTYAKAVQHGESAHTLSDEEAEAISQALDQAPSGQQRPARSADG